MDIIKRLTLKIANDPRSDWAKLATEAREHIESLRAEIRTQRHEIAQHINVRNAILEMDKPPGYNVVLIKDDFSDDFSGSALNG
jgi:hypothetical protein